MPIHNVNGQPIHAVHEGKPGRQVALLIHGWSSSWYAMSPLMPMLAQRFSVIAVDLPGYGESPPLHKRATIPDYADLLAHLIEEVSDGPVVLIGHSMGGMISAALALRYPVLVERMVMLCPTISGRLSNYINIFVSPITLMERFGLGSVIVSATEKMVVGITDRLMRPASFSERTGITEADYMRLRADARRPGQGRVRAECFSAMRASNLIGKIGKVEAPALVLWGAEDNTVPLRDASVIADEWPNADLRIIPKAGHWPHFETPDTTRRLVAAFLGLPLASSELSKQVDDNSLKIINEVAQFLAHSDVGNNLNQPQRTRLAAQCQQKMYRPGETIVSIKDGGNAMYIVQDGAVEVWSDPENPGQAPKNLKHVASLTPGQITGELAMLDGGMRSADLRAGPQGATVLQLERDRLQALAEDDAVLGSRVLWNIATAMALRVRFILWQLQRALQKANQAGASMDTAPRSSFQNQLSAAEKAQKGEKVVRTP